MKRKLLAILVAVCTAFAAMSVTPVQAAGNEAVMRFVNEIGENLYALADACSEQSRLAIVFGEEGDVYTLTQDVSGLILCVDNVAVTVDGGAYNDFCLTGASSLTDGDLTVTPQDGAPAFSGNADDLDDLFAFFTSFDFGEQLPAYAYDSDAVVDFYMRASSLTVKGDLTIRSILNIGAVQVAGDIFIEAPAEGPDPNGLNILEGGSLTLGGSFTADEGQILLLERDSVVGDNVPVYEWTQDGCVPLVLPEEHETIEFSFDAEAQGFVIRTGGADNDLYEYDCMVWYDQGRSSVFMTVGESEPLLMESNRKALFAVFTDEQTLIQELRFTVDTLHCGFDGRELDEFERVQNESISIKMTVDPFTEKEAGAWLVRDGVLQTPYAEQFAYENHELRFTPPSTVPFILTVCLNDEEYAYETFGPEQDDEAIIAYGAEGAGSIVPDGEYRTVSRYPYSKAAVPFAEESVTFTLVPEEGEELFGFSFQYEYFDLHEEHITERLISRGIVYDGQNGALTLKISAEEPYYELTAFFSTYGEGGFDQNGFMIQYRGDRGRVLISDGDETRLLEPNNAASFIPGEPFVLTLDNTQGLFGEYVSEEQQAEFSPWIRKMGMREYYEEWIVEAGQVPAHLQDAYSFEDHTLSFTPQDGEPFMLEIYWTTGERDLDFFRADEGEQIVRFFIGGGGWIDIAEATHFMFDRNNGKAAVPADAQTISARIADGETRELWEITLRDRSFNTNSENFEAELAQAGIVWNRESGVITFPYDGRDDYSIGFFFADAHDDGSDSFQVQYDGGRYAVMLDEGQGEHDLWDHEWKDYPDGEFAYTIRVTPTGEDAFRGLFVFSANGSSYYSADDLTDYTFSWSDRTVNIIRVVGPFDAAPGEFAVDYDTLFGGTVLCNGETMDPGRVYAFTPGEPIELTITGPNGEDPYRIEAEWMNMGDDVTEWCVDHQFVFTPADDEPFRISIFWSEEEYNYKRYRTDQDVLDAQITFNGKGRALVTDENGNELTVTQLSYGNRIRVLIPRNEPMNLLLTFVADEGECVEWIRIDGQEWEYSETTYLWAPDYNIGNTYFEVAFSDSEMPPCPHDEGTRLDGYREATCTQDGYSGDVVCARCGEVFEEGTVLPATGHTQIEWRSNEDQHWKECAIDHAVIDSTQGGHTESVWIVDGVPTGEAAGHHHTECTVCGRILRQEDYVTAKGDLDGDGEATARDRMILSRYLAGWDITPYGAEASAIEATCDLDGDGRITARDRAILARYLAGWGNEYTCYF